jgi:hypothetical protein
VGGGDATHDDLAQTRRRPKMNSSSAMIARMMKMVYSM